MFVPVDDPTEDIFEFAAEVKSLIQLKHNASPYTQFQRVFHGSGNKKNIAGQSLDAQDPIRIPVLSTKEFSFEKG